MRRRFVGALLLRRLIGAFVIGGLTGVIVSSVSPRKKGKSADIILGIVGAFLGGLFLRGTPWPVGVLLLEIIGALALILFGRLLAGGVK